MPLPLLPGDGEREEGGITDVDADALFDADDDDAASKRGSTKSATDEGHAEAAAAVASTTRTMRSGAGPPPSAASSSAAETEPEALTSPMPFFFTPGGVGAVFDVLAILRGGGK